MDRFVRDRLPPEEARPPLLFTRPELRYAERLNCVAELLDRWSTQDAGHATRPALHAGERTLTYAELGALVNRFARVLVEDLGVGPQARVLLRAPNTPELAAAWLAVAKVGAVAVTTMPLLRARELTVICDRAEPAVALVDARLEEELVKACARAAKPPRVVRLDGPDSLLSAAEGKDPSFTPVDTAADDPVLIAFTSGTTGAPKGAVHAHRDVLAICDTFSKHLVAPTADDVFCGTPPLAFTFGLGGLLLFPLRVGASTALLERATPEGLLEVVAKRRATAMFTSPTMYRALVDHVASFDIRSLRACVSAGETLPVAVFDAFKRATGLSLIDGIGSTEMLHIFISAAGDEIRPGATGKVVPGYEACVLDDALEPVPAGTVGRLAVRGPTGCMYLDDEARQRDYVRGGWNLTGDAYLQDEDGYFHYQARVDDLIVSSGYKIAGSEVENVLLEHPAVRECAVVAKPDEARGNVVAAFVVLHDPLAADAALASALQEHAKRELAPYKYPRVVEFVPSLPRTETGKLQRFKLREAAEAMAKSDAPLSWR